MRKESKCKSKSIHVNDLKEEQEWKVNFKFYDVTIWLTIIIHILPNILRSKGNETMKFGELIECNMRNIFLEKSYTRCGEELFLKY